MSKLSHPYCVSVIDFGVDGAPYIVMEYVEGRTLKSAMMSEQITPTRTITIVRQILAGLSHAHSQGIAHRDIKPENIMLQEAVGVGETVRIFDFGLAKLTADVPPGHMSLSIVAGTPSYMSPEQTRGKHVDERTDLYSVGIVLFEMLVGEKPFVHDDFVEVVRMHRDVDPPKLSDVAGIGAFSQEMETLVKKALAKSPDDRFQSAEEFSKALDETPEGIRAKEDIAVTPDPRGKTLPVSAKSPFYKPVEPTRNLKSSPSSPVPSATEKVVSKTKHPHSNRFRGVALLLGVFAGVLTIFVLTYDFGDADSEKKPPVISIRLPKPEPKPTKPGVPKVTPTIEPAAEPNAAKSPTLTATEVDTTPDTAEVAQEKTDTTAALPKPEIKTVKDAQKVIESGDKEYALEGLMKLRRAQPKNAQIVFLIGDIYFQKVWWGNAIDQYAEAIRLDSGYKRRASIQRDLIIALSSDKTANKATVVLKSIGNAALPALRKASKRDTNPVIRKRAESIIKKIQSR
jgi:serine/threonine-protein kinase